MEELASEVRSEREGPGVLLWERLLSADAEELLADGDALVGVHGAVVASAMPVSAGDDVACAEGAAVAPAPTGAATAASVGCVQPELTAGLVSHAGVLSASTTDTSSSPNAVLAVSEPLLLLPPPLPPANTCDVSVAEPL